MKPTGSSSGKAANNADDGSEEEFCFQHIKAINAPAGFVLPGQAQRYISFAEWLPSDVISDATQAKLRKAMEARPSAADRGEQGYIYIYELRAAGDDSHIVLKVGRAVNVFRRIDQWRAQCESKEPLLRSFQPSAPSQSFLAGAAAVHVPGIALAHRWEKLVHLELSDRGERSREQCESCGAVHKEIFRMKRAGGYEDMEGVVKKWMRFVQMVEQDSDSK